MTVCSASPLSTHLSAFGCGEITSSGHGEPGSEMPNSEMAILYLPLHDGL